MDFSRVELSDDDQAFLGEARHVLQTHVTDDVRRRDRETGDNFDEGVHLALGAAGYLEKNGRARPKAGFPEFAVASGNWRSAARMCPG